MSNNQNLNKDEMDEKILLNSLKYHGFVFPSTEKELENYIASIEEAMEKVPEHLSNPLEVINKIKVMPLLTPKTLIDVQDRENLAMAAREGKKISEKVLKQMDQDRNQAENDSNDQLD